MTKPPDQQPAGKEPPDPGAVEAVPEAAAASIPEHPAERKANRAIITVCVITASIMFTLDSTIANVALPYMQGTMSASQDEINWVLTSYIVAQAIMTAPVGYFAARFGRTRLFVMSIFGFVVTSIFCGLSQSLDQMVFFRILQGICGAPLVPLSQAVLFDIYPVERRGFAMGLWATGVNLGPILGPTLGGWLTEDYSWRWVFYINIPIGILAAGGLIIFLKEARANNPGKLDWLGFAALSLAVGAFQTVLDRGETLDWFSSKEIIIEAFLAGIGFYVFIVQSALTPKPFLSPRLFTDINFVVGTTLYFMIGLILYATLALLAPYLQDLMNYPVTTAGMVLAPRGFGTMLAAMLAGRLVRRIGVRQLLAVGLTISAYALYRMTQWTPDVSPWTVLSVGFIQGAGVSFLTIPLSVVTFATLPPAMRTEATGVYSLLRNLGSSIGISVTGALLVSNTQINHEFISGVVTPFNHAIQTLEVQRFWSPYSLSGSAALNDEITRQANIIAYIDNFKLMFVMTLMVMPLIFLIRSPPKQN